MKYGVVSAAVATFICGVALVFATGAEAAVYNYEYHPKRQANLLQIGVTAELHELVDGTGFGIAIFDGEIDDTHPDLIGKTIVDHPYAVWGVDISDDFHGTHVAGIAGARIGGKGIVGVAPGARIYGSTFFDDDGWIAYDGGVEALDLIALRNIVFNSNIIAVNMSYGPSNIGDVFSTGELEIFDNYMDEFVIVRAAGNDGEQMLNEVYTGGRASETLSHLLIVGSARRSGKLSKFSNRPGKACFVSAYGCKASELLRNYFIMAPGDYILSDAPDENMSRASGTSMAAPHVAGAVALVAHDAANKNVSLSPSQIASILKESATDLGRPGVDKVFGWGLLNVPAALSPIGPLSLATGSMVPSSDSGGNVSQTSFAAGRLHYSGTKTTVSSLLSGLVMFDKFGRPFQIAPAALVRPAKSTLSERGLNVLGMISGQRTVDVDSGEHAFLAWSATGLDGKATSSMQMVAGDHEVNVGLGAPELFLMEVPSNNRAAAPQRFSRIMFSSLGEVGELFDDALSLGLNTKLGDRLSGHIFGLTETGWQKDRAPALLAAVNAKKESDADFVSAGLSYLVADGWSVGGSYAVLRERGTVAGMASSGALSLGKEALTQFWGANVTGDIDKTLSLSAFYTRAVINSSGTENSLFEAAKNWGADHYGVMLDAKNVVHENSVLRLSLVKPLQITSGTTSVRVPVGRELDGTINYVHRRSDFDGSALPLEAGLAYLAETGAGTFGLTLDLVDTNLNGAGERGVTVGTGFTFAF